MPVLWVWLGIKEKKEVVSVSSLLGGFGMYRMGGFVMGKYYTQDDTGKWVCVKCGEAFDKQGHVLSHIRDNHKDKLNVRKFTHDDGDDGKHMMRTMMTGGGGGAGAIEQHMMMNMMTSSPSSLMKRIEELERIQRNQNAHLMAMLEKRTGSFDAVPWWLWLLVGVALGWIIKDAVKPEKLADKVIDVTTHAVKKRI